MLLALAGIVLIASAVFARLPRPIAGVGTLDLCVLTQWPVVVFEGEDWRGAFPDDLRQSAPRQVPIVEWPGGMRFDQKVGALLDADGTEVFRTGDRVKVEGSLIQTGGDPAPCDYTLGMKVTEIASP